MCVGIQKHWNKYEIKCKFDFELMFNHSEPNNYPQVPGSQSIHLELPGGSHHDDEIHIGVNGCTHPCIVVHKLFWSHQSIFVIG